MIRPARVALSAALALTLAASGAASAAAAPPSAAVGAPADAASWAADTWRSMAAMADPSTGLPADNIGGDLSPASRARYTSPTNIGAYIWSAVAA
ncbi:hypothetical protein JNW87_10505, partial [Micromonospora sp. ATA51]|nr:hypothetical protein [Micromonospora sp. ATA51]